MLRKMFKLLFNQRGDIFGGGGGDAPKAGPVERGLASLFSQQRRRFGPVQRDIIGAARGPLLEAFRTDLSPQDRETIEGQFGQARESTLSNVPGRGGLMNRMLGNLDIERARTVSNAANQARQVGIQRALATLGPAGAPGLGMFGAGQGLAQLEQGRTQMGAQAGGALGGGLGGLLGGGMGLLGRLIPGAASTAVGLPPGLGAILNNIVQ